MILPLAIKKFQFHCKFEKNLTIKTQQAYKIDLTQFEKFKDNGYLSIEEFDKNILKDYVQNLYSLDLKIKTIKRKVAVLKAFFNYMEFDEIILVNPFRKIHLAMKEPKLLPKTLELSEIKKLFKYLYKIKNNHHDISTYKYKALIRDMVVIEILFSTGVRISELCNLTQMNIDLKTGVIKIYGKGHKERIIQICDNEVIKLIKEYIVLFDKFLQLSEFFFINRLGVKLSEQSVRLMIQKYQKHLGMRKHVTPHMFRHTFATLLLEEGVDIRYIQQMLGHSSISTTQIYTQVNMKQQRKILNSKHPRRYLKFIDE